MDNHPIPQDVTGFQFKLIGSMTIKQFAYVGAGVVLSVVFFYSPLVWFIKFPLIPFFGILGVSLAFLPIAGRPMDLIASYFIKAILKPNQYVYQKVGGSLSFMDLNLQPIAPQTTTTPQASTKNTSVDHQKEQRLLTYLYGSASDSNSPLDQKESQLISNLFAQPVPVSAVINTPAHSIPAPTPVNPPQPPVPPLPSATQTELRPAASMPDINTQVTPATTITQITTNNETKNVAPQTPTRSSPSNGMDFPNLIKGIIKDARGNILPGILVDVLNKDQESVRAFKSNNLGQFMSATQLTNGTYTITFEDPKKHHRFEPVQIEATGSVLPPLTVVSVDAREELRRSLFG